MKFRWEEHHSVLSFLVIFLTISCSSFAISEAQSNNNDDLHIPEGKGYKVKNVKENIDWFLPIRSFVNGIAPSSDDLPIDTFVDLTGDVTKNLKSSGVEILKKEGGITTFMVIGLLFAITLPIVGVIAACCLCCSSKKVELTSNRQCLVCFYIVLLLASLLGILYMFASGTLLHESLNEISPTVGDSLDDAITFLNNTQVQIRYITDDAYNDKKNKIIKELDSIQKNFGEPLVTELTNQIEWTDLEKDLNKVEDVMNHSFEMIQKIHKIIEEINKLQKNVDDVRSEITDCPKELKDIVMKLTVNDPNVIAPAAEEFEKWKLELNNHINEILEAKKKFPAKLEETTTEARNDVKKTLSDIQKTLKEMNDEFRKLTDQTDTTISDAKQTVNSMFQSEDVKIIYDTVYKVFVAVSATLLVTWCFFFLGLTGGSIFYQKKKRPEERSCLSSCSGCFILLGMAMVFVFALFFFFISVILFAVGTHLEVYVCSPLYDEPDYSVMTKYTAIISGKNDEYYMGKLLLGNGSINLQLKNILKNCQDNHTVYKVLQLEFLLDLEAKLNSSKSFEESFRNLVRSFTVDTMIIPNSKPFQDNLKNQKLLQIENLDQLNSKHIFQGDVFEKLKDNTHNFACASLLDTLIQSYTEITENLTDINENIDLFKETSENSTKKILEKAAISLQTSLDLLRVKENQVVIDVSMEYLQKMLVHVNGYINFTRDSIYKKVAGCKPLWNMYASTREMLCRNLVDPLNGFWFGLGWSMFFFTILLVVGVKLSHFFRIMKSKNDIINHDELYYIQMNEVTVRTQGYYH